MMKNLVVYYSRTGNTEKIAKEIEEKVGCDIQSIIDKKNRKGFFGFIVAAFDALLSKETEIEPISCNPSEYEMVIIGTPIWAGKMTPAVRTFLKRYKESLDKTVLFTTSGGEECKKVKESIEELIQKDIVSSLSIIEKELKSKDYQKKLETFIEEIKKSS